MIVGGIVLEKALRADFMKAYESTSPAALMKLLMQTDSKADTEKYGWLGSAPVMREFKDEKMPKGLIDHDYSIKNVPFEATLAVDKFTLRNDQLGGIKVRINDLAKRAKEFPAKLLTDLMVNGTSELCYDGQAFYSASHSEGDSGTQSNIYTGTGVTTALLTADFRGARARMRAFKDDRGEPFNEGQQQLVVVCGPSLEGAFEELLNAAMISNTTNVLKGAAELVVSSRITDNDWYLNDISGGLRPFILQENMPVTFGALEGESESGFLKRHYHYGVEWYGNAGYGLWQKSVKVNN